MLMDINDVLSEYDVMWDTSDITMPNLSYVDFIPRLIDDRVCFSTLSLSAGVPGPRFETYE